MCCVRHYYTSLDDEKTELKEAPVILPALMIVPISLMKPRKLEAYTFDKRRTWVHGRLTVDPL